MNTPISAMGEKNQTARSKCGIQALVQKHKKRGGGPGRLRGNEHMTQVDWTCNMTDAVFTLLPTYLDIP
jgi:hypothetical protein